MSQRNRAAGCVTFGWVVGNGVGQTILYIKRCRCQKRKSVDVLHDKSTFIRKNGHFEFLRPSLRGLGATYADYLRLIGKPLVDFLLVIIELFSLGAMVQALRANSDWKSPFLKGVSNFHRKFHVERDITQPVSVAQWVKPLLNRPQCLLARRAEYSRRPGFKARLGRSFSARLD